MGVRQALLGRKAYFDANVFIYLMEGFPGLEKSLADIRDSIRNGESEIFTSELTICEVLMLPFRDNKAALVAKYRQFIEGSGAFTLLPTTRETYIRASLARAQHGLKTPDAIHLASAIESGCAVFVSNDRKIKVPKGIEILDLGDD